MKVITITLNPAFDIHCHCEHFKPFNENLVNIISKSSGGKGINISRALSLNGIENTALVVLGEENAEDFRRALSEYTIDVDEILVKGRIRENITIHTDNVPETRISFSGFEVNESLLKEINDMIDIKKLQQDDIVTLTGRLPKGVSLNSIKQMLLDMKNKGIRTVIDSKSFGLQDIIECRPWLIKPNEEEIEEYIGYKVNSVENAALSAEALREQGIDNVIISLGDKGAVLACEAGCFIAEAPNVKVCSTIGAGDSSIAGFIAATKNGNSYADMLKTAVCYGSAACMTEGPEPPLKEHIKMLFEKVHVRQI